MSDQRESNVLRSACILVVLMLALAVGLAACVPTPFVAGREIAPPAGCADARERGHEC